MFTVILRKRPGKTGRRVFQDQTEFRARQRVRSLEYLHDCGSLHRGRVWVVNARGHYANS